jgi:hypothetical protein
MTLMTLLICPLASFISVTACIMLSICALPFSALCLIVPDIFAASLATSAFLPVCSRILLMWVESWSIVAVCSDAPLESDDAPSAIFREPLKTCVAELFISLNMLLRFSIILFNETAIVSCGERALISTVRSPLAIAASSSAVCAMCRKKILQYFTVSPTSSLTVM